MIYLPRIVEKACHGKGLTGHVNGIRIFVTAFDLRDGLFKAIIK